MAGTFLNRHLIVLLLVTCSFGFPLNNVEDGIQPEHGNGDEVQPDLGQVEEVQPEQGLRDWAQSRVENEDEVQTGDGQSSIGHEEEVQPVLGHEEELQPELGPREDTQSRVETEDQAELGQEEEEQAGLELRGEENPGLGHGEEVQSRLDDSEDIQHGLGDEEEASSRLGQEGVHPDLGYGEEAQPELDHWEDVHSRLGHEDNVQPGLGDGEEIQPNLVDDDTFSSHKDFQDESHSNVVVTLPTAGSYESPSDAVGEAKADERASPTAGDVDALPMPLAPGSLFESITLPSPHDENSIAEDADGDNDEAAFLVNEDEGVAAFPIPIDQDSSYDTITLPNSKNFKEHDEIFNESEILFAGGHDGVNNRPVSIPVMVTSQPLNDIVTLPSPDDRDGSLTDTDEEIDDNAEIPELEVNSEFEDVVPLPRQDKINADDNFNVSVNTKDQEMDQDRILNPEPVEEPLDHQESIDNPIVYSTEETEIHDIADLPIPGEELPLSESEDSSNDSDNKEEEEHNESDIKLEDERRHPQSTSTSTTTHHTSGVFTVSPGQPIISLPRVHEGETNIGPDRNNTSKCRQYTTLYTTPLYFPSSVTAKTTRANQKSHIAVENFTKPGTNIDFRNSSQIISGETIQNSTLATNENQGPFTVDVSPSVVMVQHHNTGLMPSFTASLTVRRTKSNTASIQSSTVNINFKQNPKVKSNEFATTAHQTIFISSLSSHINSVTEEATLLSHIYNSEKISREQPNINVASVSKMEKHVSSRCMQCDQHAWNTFSTPISEQPVLNSIETSGLQYSDMHTDQGFMRTASESIQSSISTKTFAVFSSIDSSTPQMATENLQGSISYIDVSSNTVKHGEMTSSSTNEISSVDLMLASSTTSEFGIASSYIQSDKEIESHSRQGDTSEMKMYVITNQILDTFSSFSTGSSPVTSSIDAKPTMQPGITSSSRITDSILHLFPIDHEIVMPGEFFGEVNEESRKPSLMIHLTFRMNSSQFCSHQPDLVEDLVNIMSHGVVSINKQQVVLINSCQGVVNTSGVIHDVVFKIYLQDRKGYPDNRLTSDCAKWISAGFHAINSTYFKDKLVEVKLVRHPTATSVPFNTSTDTSFNKDVDEEALPNHSKTVSRLETGITVAIAIASVGGVCCIAVIILQLLLHRKHGRKMNVYIPSISDRFSIPSLDSIALASVTKDRPYSGLWNPGLEDDLPEHSHSMNYVELSNFTLDTQAMYDEFQSIPNEMPSLSTVPRGAEDKNRYANVIAIPGTRVKLKKIGNEDGSDYINANFVTGYQMDNRAYIATQAPLRSTLCDFWRMVWEYQTRTVLMLTAMDEHGQPRCNRYWPDEDGLDRIMQFGDFSVVSKKKEIHQTYIMSVFELKDIENNLLREVHHFWFTCWPMNKTPEPLSLVKFLLDTRPHYEDSGAPVIVHCSPGTGRTGTLIALDICMRMFEDKRRTDVLRCIHDLRLERAGAVQNKEQYVLLYLALHKYATVLNSPSISTSSSAVTLHAML